MKFLISGLKKEIELRKMTLADEIWIAEKFPDYSERLSRSNPDMGMICQIVYRLIVDKSQFVTEKIKTVNESGEEIEIAYGGVEKLTRACESNVDTVTIATMFAEACNKARPDAKKDVKKKKKFLNSLIIGSMFIFLVACIIGSLVKFLL